MLERVKKAVERLLHFMVSAAFLVLIANSSRLVRPFQN